MKISILMATYNPKEEYLVLSIKSILNQTFKDFEFIIIDDGSDVDLRNVLKENLINDNRIRIIKLEKNCGLPKALNYGLQLCKGEFIARMDDDDISKENRLEEQYKFLKSNKKYVGCWTLFDCIDENGNPIDQKQIIVNPEKILKRLIIKGNFLCHSTLFIKREILNSINGYDENLLYAQDNDLYIRLLEKYNMKILDKKMVSFRKTVIRKNVYRDCLANSFVHFSKKYFIKRNKNNLKYKIWYFRWLLRSIIIDIFGLSTLN